ncbi:MAG: glycosyltransferase family 4 protein [Planctomycetaceae bacterium]|nr:glycosyltransferase family 4 protein [Planctomycetaceae bacterium]
MRIVFLISGRKVPSSRFRILQYLPFLKNSGHECLVLPSRPPKYRGWPWLGNRLSEVPRMVFRLVDLLRVSGYRPDVVVIERELFSSGFCRMEHWLSRRRWCLVLDVDDALFALHPRKFPGLVQACDLVLAGNGLLRDRIAALHPVVEILPTSLDVERFTLRRNVSPSTAAPVTIGWTGTAGNYPQLVPLLDVFRRLATRYDFRLHLIAERPPEELNLTGLRTEFTRWTEGREIEDLQRFDLGVMPLEDTEWNRFKCGLKILQYMATGAAVVASPVGANAEIIQHGRNGFLAGDLAEWEQCLSRLLESPEQRAALVRAGRETVEQHYSIQRQAPRLMTFLAEGVQRARLRGN